MSYFKFGSKKGIALEILVLLIALPFAAQAQQVAQVQCRHRVQPIFDNEFETATASIGEACTQATNISIVEVAGACTGTGGIYIHHSCRTDVLPNGKFDTGYLYIGVYYCNVTCHGECHYVQCSPTSTANADIGETEILEPLDISDIEELSLR